ncbi:TetR/AcrR family transcriptional regulator [Nocardia blacklockiae]|uniref:TetR/AcrR family transcriptional regulator n=1 Tax=Nocardia blacklockiae TaxID=480036 RepID=UPI001893912E|nr:TetR family transcriptional regulator [Nocardia blacklockiae]MBF6175987.1 TetR family transcriptional regulator [Nocardia blacklockiae]
MSRWEPNARERLAQAALDLYTERGFDQTTVAEIAKRAGLTERTFFRYFADKREVLFAGQGVLRDLMVAALEQAPATATPLAAVATALRAVVEPLQADPGFARKRQSAVSGNAELRERELIKLAMLASALADALRRRGVRDPAAALAAETGIAVFKISYERWIAAPGQRTLRDFIEESLAELRTVTAGLPV